MRWRWQWVLQPEDADWLGDIATKKCSSHPWLWERLLGLVSQERSSTRLRIRKLVRQRAPHVIKEFDKAIRKHIAWERKHRKEKEKRESEQKAKQVSLVDAVKQTLENKKLSTHERLVQLSWLCLSGERHAPTNVVGTWDDLDSRFQKRVIETCAQALSKSKSTPIPIENSYPASIVYESHAFVEVLGKSETYKLDEKQIEKWLPSTLVFTIPDSSHVLTRCLQTNRIATDRVLVTAIRRELGYRDEGSITAANLSADCWSKALGDAAAKRDMVKCCG